MTPAVTRGPGHPDRGGLVLVDERGHVEQIDDAVCALVGTPADALLSRPVSGLFTEAGRTVFRTHLLTMLQEQGRVEDFALAVRHVDGRLHGVLIDATVVAGRPSACRLRLLPYGARRIGHGEALRARRAADLAPGMTFGLHNAPDASCRFPACRAADRMRRAQTDFLRRVSHELRAPLNAILAFSQMLLDDEPGRLSDRQLQQLRLIGAAGDQLCRLVEDLTTIGRGAPGRFAVQPAPVDALEVLRRSLALASPQAVEAEVSLMLDPAAADSVVVIADERRLAQVFDNLLSNAIKYNRRGGRVQVRLRAFDERLQVAVHDTGQGITPEQQLRLFRPFERLGAEVTDVPGTGLGLAICRQLVHDMGGGIAVDSTPGVGSVFRVDLVRAMAGGASMPLPPDTVAPGALAAPAPDGTTVLYVEDNPINVYVMSAIVDRCRGARLQVSTSVAGALAEVRERLPDVLLIDHQLPDGCGIALLHRLRDEHPCLHDVPAVLVTGCADRAHEAIDAGFDNCWVKPLDVGRTVAALQRLLAPRPAGPRNVRAAAS